MSFRLSDRSTAKLDKVDSNLVALVKMAILKTKVDFGVICGLRTIQEQKLLVDKGVSQTMDSKHISGRAVDLMAYVGSRASWELKKASQLIGVPVRWGAAWHIKDIAEYEGTMEEAMNEYIDLRRSQGRRPFIDGPHFELAD